MIQNKAYQAKKPQRKAWQQVKFLLRCGVDMVSWNITLGLMVMAFTLPFIFLRTKIKSTRRRASDEHNEVQQLRSMLTELEERIRHDQSLFLEALGVPFLLMRPSGRVVMANRKAAELFDMESMANTNLLRLLPDSELRRMLQQATQSTDRMRFMVKVPRADGERIYRATSTHLATREKHIGIVFLDMTEEHRTQVIRRDFVANASHELRTPLTLILGYLETLQDDPESTGGNQLWQRALSIMRRHAERMARLVEDMLMLSRVETPGSGYLKMENFDLSQLACEVCQRLEATAAAQHASISLQITPEEFCMQGDAFYWSQVLYNLLENALKNNPAPGLTVTLTAEQQEDSSRVIRIEDNGIGIPAEAIPFIFNRFYRADKSGKVKGTGLGLSIVKHAVEAHGGRISVESTPGVRTCFSIVIPPSAS